MSIFKHKRTGILYRKLLESFSVERQCKSVIYMGLETGEIFDRDADKFKENFQYLSNPQEHIEPKDLSAELPLQRGSTDPNAHLFKDENKWEIL